MLTLSSSPNKTRSDTESDLGGGYVTTDSELSDLPLMELDSPLNFLKSINPLEKKISFHHSKKWL